MPAIYHLGNYNLHGSIGNKTEFYEARACRAGGKNANRGEVVWCGELEEEEGLICVLFRCAVPRHISF